MFLACPDWAKCILQIVPCIQIRMALALPPRIKQQLRLYFANGHHVGCVPRVLADIQLILGQGPMDSLGLELPGDVKTNRFAHSRLGYVSWN